MVKGALRPGRLGVQSAVKRSGRHAGPPFLVVDHRVHVTCCVQGEKGTWVGYGCRVEDSCRASDKSGKRIPCVELADVQGSWLPVSWIVLFVKRHIIPGTVPKH